MNILEKRLKEYLEINGIKGTIEEGSSSEDFRAGWHAKEDGDVLKNILNYAHQMRLEQQTKIDSYSEFYNSYELGVLNGIDRIVKLIERSCTDAENNSLESKIKH